MKRSEVRKKVVDFVLSNNVGAVFGKDEEGLIVVRFLVDEEEKVSDE